MSIELPIKPNVDHPLKSLEGLSYILCHKELWPEDFMWDYRHCNTCAMGLASSIFMGGAGKGCGYNMLKLFGEWPGKSVSNKLYEKLGKSMRNITPEDVADAIDSYLSMKG